MDWDKIRAELEAGASKSALAERYGVSRRQIIRKSQEWVNVTPEDVTPQNVTGDVTPLDDRKDVLIVRRDRSSSCQFMCPWCGHMDDDQSSHRCERKGRIPINFLEIRPLNKFGDLETWDAR